MIKRSSKIKVKNKKNMTQKKQTEKKNSTSIVKAKQGKQTKDKLMLSQSPLSAKQTLFVLQKTPKNHIYKRPGKGKGEFEYVTGTYMKKVLNYAFGWLWDTEVVNSGEVVVNDKVVQIWVDVKLIINRINPKTKEIEKMITKTQTGRSDVKYLRSNPKTPVDYGNDRKAAITDGLKKCAAELGVASDVYGKHEFKEIQQNIDKEFTPPENGGDEPIYCHGVAKTGCEEGAVITEQERKYSEKMFGKPLCRDCQKNAKNKK